MTAEQKVLLSTRSRKRNDENYVCFKNYRNQRYIGRSSVVSAANTTRGGVNFLHAYINHIFLLHNAVGEFFAYEYVQWTVNLLV
jgi:hypothetical protein